MRGILLFFGVIFFSSISYSQDNREFRYDTEFGSRRPRIVENWDGGDGHLRVTLIESSKDVALSSVKKLLQEFGPRERVLFLNLDHKPETPSELEEMILEDSRVQKLPSDMARGLREELAAYKEDRSDLVKKHSKHIAAIHFTSSLGAFTLLSYLGEDLPHLAHWLVGFAVAWECWLAQRYLISVNKFIYNITDNFFKGTESLFNKLGLKNKVSVFAVDLEKTLDDEHPHRSFPKKLMVSFFTLITFCAEWALFEVQHSWIKDFFGPNGADGGSFLRGISQLGTWSLWAFVLKASLLDLFSEGIPHWAVNNYSRTSKLNYVQQAKFIHKWSSAISIFVTFTTLGALATNVAVFKWISFPIAAAGLGYFIFDGVIRNHHTKNKLILRAGLSKSTQSDALHRPVKKYSCFLRLSSN